MNSTEALAGIEALRRIADVSHETVERIETFQALLVEWQRRVNLVGQSTLAAFWTRHVLDAAFVHRVGHEERRWIDAGSGAGLPGLIIALLLAESGDAARLESVEANQRKCAFQRAVVLATGLRDTAVDVGVRAVRLEHYTPPHADMVLTARAFAPLHDILVHVQRLYPRPSRLLLLKGARHREEVEAARRSFTFGLTVHPHPVEQGSVLLDIRSIGPAAAAGAFHRRSASR